MRSFPIMIASIVCMACAVLFAGVAGTVVDAATGRPILNYSFILRPADRTDSIWQQTTV